MKYLKLFELFTIGKNYIDLSKITKALDNIFEEIKDITLEVDDIGYNIYAYLMEPQTIQGGILNATNNYVIAIKFNSPNNKSTTSIYKIIGELDLTFKHLNSYLSEFKFLKKVNTMNDLGASLDQNNNVILKYIIDIDKI